MCAAGCLIADEEYSADFENKSWFHLVEYHGLTSKNLDLISALQRVHDGRAVSEWPLWLKHVAEKFNLKTYAVM